MGHLLSLDKPYSPTQPLTGGAQDTTPIVGTLTPIQLETAYGTNLLGLANQGQGVTIGIVDELDDPNIMADANAYSTQYGLPLPNGVGGIPLPDRRQGHRAVRNGRFRRGYGRRGRDQSRR